MIVTREQDYVFFRQYIYKFTEKIYEDLRFYLEHRHADEFRVDNIKNIVIETFEDIYGNIRIPQDFSEVIFETLTLKIFNHFYEYAMEAAEIFEDNSDDEIEAIQGITDVINSMSLKIGSISDKCGEELIEFLEVLRN